MRACVQECVSGLWIMYKWQIWLMWGIRFPASQRRGCESVPKPNALCSWLQKVWSGLTHIQTQTHSLSQTCAFALTHTRICTLSFHTHLHTCTCKCTHTQSGLPVLPNRNTQGLCAGWWVWDGWREGLLSTPVFAAVIRGTCYFGAAGIHALTHRHTHTHAVKNTERALSGGAVQ